MNEEAFSLQLSALSFQPGRAGNWMHRRSWRREGTGCELKAVDKELKAES
jgi:hypothetical protein